MVTALFPGETIVCLATGPSLSQADVDRCRGRARLLAIKDAIQLAPDADVLYACDAKWWRHHPETATFAGQKFGMEVVAERKDVQYLKNTGEFGLDLTGQGLRTGRNSGYQAINLAVQLGATRIVLLGYDMQSGPKNHHHFFGNHRYRQDAPPYGMFLPFFQHLIAPLAQLGIEIVNASRTTRLNTFPRQSLERALGIHGEAVA